MTPAKANPAPFCAVVAYNAVHSPMQGLHTDLARLGHIEDDQRRIFAAMLVAMDRGVGAITKTLAELDLTQKTLVVFVSDNGGPTAELTSSNQPLRGGKGTLYEGGVRVPMVWSMPGTLPAGVTEDRVVVSVDIAATALRAAGLAVPESMDGRDFLGWFGRHDETPLHREVYWRMSHGRTAYRWDDWKIVRPNRGRPFELYDLASDQAEQKNLADLKPGVLKNTLRQWRLIDSSMAPPIHLPN